MGSGHRAPFADSILYGSNRLISTPAMHRPRSFRAPKALYRFRARRVGLDSRFPSHLPEAIFHQSDSLDHNIGFPEEATSAKVKIEEARKGANLYKCCERRRRGETKRRVNALETEPIHLGRIEAERSSAKKSQIG